MGNMKMETESMEDDTLNCQKRRKSGAEPARGD
jgi:hypothetical protein